MNNKFPQITFIYDRYKKATSSRKASVEMRITYNYAQKYISTGIMLYPHQWRNGKIVECTELVHFSQVLDKLLTDVRQVIYDMIREGSIDIKAIPDRLKQASKSEMTFIDFCIQRSRIKEYGKASDTRKRYERFIRLFQQWGEIIQFDDINEKSIISYDRYLASKGMKAYSKWNNYHRFLNSFIMDAIDDGHVIRNPYKWLNIQKDKSTKGISRCLTPDEFRKLKTSQMPTGSLERVRDLFVFQTYTCLSYSDLKAFDYKKIQEIKGVPVYTDSRRKTSKSFTIPLLSPALDILHRYEGQLPVISNVKYNEYLKIVAQASGIDKPLSSHWARHTGATLLLNEGVDMKIIARICGHSSTRITEQIYAKLLDETVVDAVTGLDI